MSEDINILAKRLRGLIKINRILIIFIAFIVVLGMIAKSILQSQFFATILSNELSYVLKKESSCSISFKKLEVLPFSLATEIKSIDVNCPEVLIAKFDKLILKYGLLDFLSNRIGVSSINLSGGNVSYLKEVKSPKNKSGEISNRELIKLINKKIQNLPFTLYELTLNNIWVIASENVVEFKELKLNYLGDFVSSKFDFFVNSVELKQFKKIEKSHFRLDLDLSEKMMRLNKGAWNNGIDYIAGEGEYYFQNEEIDASVAYKGGSNFIANNLKSFLPKKFEYKNSYVDFVLDIKKRRDYLKGIYEIEVEDVNNSYLKASKVTSKGTFDKTTIKVKELEVLNKNSFAKIEKTVVIDYKNFSNITFPITLSNVDTKDAFHFLGGVLDPFYGKISGRSVVEIGRDLLKFTINNKIKLNKVKVQLKNGKFPIVHSEEIEIYNSFIRLKDWEHLTFDIVAKTGESEVKVDGFLDREKINLDLNSSKLKIQDFGKISNLNILGEGSAKISVKGPYGDTRFSFRDVELKNSSIENYSLGETKIDFDISLKKSEMDFKNIFSKHLGSIARAKGKIYLNKNSPIDYDFKVSATKINYDSIQSYFKPIFPKLVSNIHGLNLNSNGEVIVRGKFEKFGMSVDGNFITQEVSYSGENIRDLRFRFEVDGENIRFKKIRFTKGVGIGKAFAFFNTKIDSFEYDIILENSIFSQYFFASKGNLGLESTVDLEFYGSGTYDDYATKSSVVLRKSKIGTKNLGNSKLTIYITSKDAKVVGNLFRDRAYFDANIFFDKQKKSKFSASLNFQDLREVFGIISARNILSPNIEGVLNAKILLSTNVYNFKDLDLDLNLNSFFFNLGGKVISSGVGGNKIKVENGIVKNWDMNLFGDTFNLKSIANGSFSDRISIENNFNIPVKILTLFSEEFVKLEGTVKGEGVIIFDDNNIDSFASLVAEKSAISLKNIPNEFTDIKIKINQDGKNLLINELSSNYGGGKVKIDGLVGIKIPFPSLSLSIKLDDTGVDLLNATNVVVDGDLNLRGKIPPYKLNGGIVILNGKVEDSLFDLLKEVGNSVEYRKYLPPKVRSSKENLIDLGVSFETQNPVQVKNNLLDIFMNGKVLLTGSVGYPILNGQTLIQESVSKLNFKGHEFYVKKGIFTFGGSESEGKVPFVEFESIANLGEYKVSFDVSGVANKATVKLKSSPPLSEENIFSLLTLGVTNDLSKNLDDEEANSLKTVGLGTFIFDQLKLTEGLNENFGIRLSLTPELQEDDANLLKHQSSDTSLAAKKIKSSTKLRLEKKLGKKVGISFSSTLGGETEQKQEMNIDYKINEKISVQGVYELKSGEESTGEGDDSAGADLKYQWSF